MPQESHSGDVGFCREVGHSYALIRTWEDGIIISVDCNHKICGYEKRCEMYQRGPVGGKCMRNHSPLADNSE